MVDFKFKSFSAARRLIAKAGFIAGIVLGVGLTGQMAVAQQNENLLETLRLSSQQADMLGLERKVFDFKNPKLNFETFIPKGAELKLNAYEDQKVEEGQIGRVLPLGKVTFTYEDVAIEDTIYSYKLRYAPAALRTCQWQMQEDGYFILHSVAKNKLAEAELFGLQFEGENKTPVKAEFGYCYARGDVLIAHFFSAPFAAAHQQMKTTQILRKTVSYLTSNMMMADGKPNAIDDSLMQNLAVDLDGDTLLLTYPKGLDVVVNNSERKILPYEFHLVQKLQTGEMFSHLFLWINKASEPASEESFRRQADIFAEIYVSSQLNANADNTLDTAASEEAPMSDNAKSEAATPAEKPAKNVHYEFIGRNSIPGFAQVGIMARSYQYQIIEKDNQDHPTLFFVSVIGHKDKTYVLYYHSLRGGVSKASEYFTGLAGDIAYDSIRESIYNFLVGLK